MWGLGEPGGDRLYTKITRHRMTVHAGTFTSSNSALKTVQCIITVDYTKGAHWITVHAGSYTPNNSTPKTVQFKVFFTIVKTER